LHRDGVPIPWSPMPRRIVFLTLMAGALAVGTVGCDQKLATGYEPRRLNANDADRRAYYAPAFAPAPTKDSSGGGMPNLAHP